jgi:hypothetical protein
LALNSDALQNNLLQLLAAGQPSSLRVPKLLPGVSFDEFHLISEKGTPWTFCQNQVSISIYASKQEQTGLLPPVEFSPDDEYFRWT